MKIREYINRIIFFLTVSDIFTWGTIAIITPFMAIFLSQKFGDQTIFYVGVATSCYYISRAVFQIPIGIFSDKLHHDKDEIIILSLGCFIMGIGYILIPFIYEPWQYFLIMAFIGFGASMNLNSWRKLFSANLDRKHEGVGFGFYETIMSFATAIICIVGGYFSSLSYMAFEIVLIVFGVAIILGGLVSGSIFFMKNRKSKNL